MVNSIGELVRQWIKLAEKDLITSKQVLDAESIVTESVCFHAQQAVEKLLKAFLVKHQAEFPNTHNLMVLINLCSKIDPEFKKIWKKRTS
ncbi:MAG: HEPN domain-containing protein [Oligoflexia bacterium]|nr:HEPN domain-containing protein [Oligoflexia bacterium]